MKYYIRHSKLEFSKQLAFVALFLAASTAQAKTLNCTLEIQGAGKTETSFDSGSPSLVVKETLESDPQNPMTTTLLSADRVCGVSVEVKASCTAQERQSAQLGYDYTLSCGPTLKLEFYVDENGDGHGTCTTSDGTVDRIETSNCQ